MSTIRNPVGPQSARVYWRRRIVVGILLLAVLIGVVLIIARCSSGPGPSTGGTNPPSSSSPTASSDPDDAVACDPRRVTVEAVTNAQGYDPGVIPQLSLVVKSTETTPCTLEVGTDLQVFTITSGDEVIWKSTDCQVDPQPRTQLLNPGVPVSSAAIPWDRTRSSPDTCDVPREEVTGGGASYHLDVAIDELKSPTTKQFILY